MNDLVCTKECNKQDYEKPINIKWISCKDELPELGDYSVLVCAMHGEILPDTPKWTHGAYDCVHVEDYFRDIQDGFDEYGKPIYTKWYLSCGITHFAYVNLPE